MCTYFFRPCMRYALACRMLLRGTSMEYGVWEAMEQGITTTQIQEYQLCRTNSLTFFRRESWYQAIFVFLALCTLKVSSVSSVNPSDLTFVKSWGSKLSRFMSLNQVCTDSYLLFLANNRNFVLGGLSFWQVLDIQVWMMCNQSLRDCMSSVEETFKQICVSSANW